MAQWRLAPFSIDEQNTSKQQDGERVSEMDATDSTGGELQCRFMTEKNNFSIFFFFFIFIIVLCITYTHNFIINCLCS